MKIGIIGLPQVGKRTLFNLVTTNQVNKSKGGFGEVVIGTAEVKDERLKKLAEIHESKKITPVNFEYYLFPAVQNEPEKTRRLISELSEMDAVLHVVRVFSDENVFHADGSVDMFRDIEKVNTELVFSDLFKIERRMQKLEKEIKKIKNADKQKEYEVIKKCKNILEEETFLRDADFTEDEARLIRGFQFLTKKGMLVVLNVDENGLSNNELLGKAKAKYENKNTICLQVCAKLEQEIIELPEEERSSYMEALGIKHSVLDELTKCSFNLLDLIEYFTAGEPEARAWPIKKGTSAQKAAGEIHSDIERGFIRAEVIRYSDLLNVGGSIAKAREKGYYKLKGKEYVVEEGDVILFRFNV